MNPNTITRPCKGKAWTWFAIGLTGFALAACQPKGEEKPEGAVSTEAVAGDGSVSGAKPSMTVTVEKPNTGSVGLSLDANGNVSAWQEASVGAEVSGLRLATVKANVGDQVRKGQVLATFVTATAEAESLQGKAAVMQAEANYENAKADADRARSIQDTGALSKSQIAQYLTAEKVGKAQWEAAKAGYSASQVRLGNTSVKAPDDGVISARSATVGGVVGAGQELFRMVRQGRMEWRGEVTPSEVGRVKVGQSVNVTLATGTELIGQVRAISPTADLQTRNIIVYVDLPRHSELTAGTFAKGRFELGESQALTVPATALVVRDGHNYVFVIDADSKASQRKVQTGRRVGDRVELLDGLTAEEGVAVKGAGFLNEGDLVKVVE
ncbi:efflux transporter periplasmic adaptor subunit [Hydrogenophaga crassostreae]|uniref:Efflux transporter periplasmic adaptor subunit n=1 Tax=Hydrogenophaga crassostreae TaxID=1763535 RepID=A0A167HXD8_9BURK|nr:efflux RND transporter periplasmic adaptor subunit [Hydrogenophaga crassostreae]AOW13567.1 efflux transporter periplasmic adaptor subunit [Hydrogenophaga crassostreae]OAD41860.1 efflux transporter periplasmic adaptor subunit [Hydrogenophaga crassostreae]